MISPVTFTFFFLLLAVVLLIFGGYFFLHPKAYFYIKKSVLESAGLKGIRATASFYELVRFVSLFWIGLGIFLLILSFQSYRQGIDFENTQIFSRKFDELIEVVDSSSGILLINTSSQNVELYLNDCFISKDLSGIQVGEDFQIKIPALSEVQVPDAFVRKDQISEDRISLASIPLQYCSQMELVIEGESYFAYKTAVPF